ncbi:MAG: HlyC/CorC family transporter [Bryobacterales bacterium]|nr:HlyC/CorC family transporter [Bryobacterales bacterium]
MGNIGLEVSLIFLLVLANGVFSMAEMAVVSARKARLRQRSDDGERGATVALALADNPHDFLSTVQIGITLIGTLAGAFGGATIAEKLSVFLKQYPVIAPYSDSVSITVVVVIIAYLSLILGELVPKNIALSNPEGIASAIAPPMRGLSRIGAPAVQFLTFSTKIVMKVLPVKPSSEAPVTEEEVKVLIAQGTQHGTFEEAEQEMVEGVFRLGDRRIVELMQPRGRVAALDVSAPWAANREVLTHSRFSRFPVIEGDLDRILGIVHVKELFLSLDAGQAPDLRRLARPPLLVPETTPALDVLDRLKETGEQMAVVVDEHGGVQGISTLTDLVESVVGDLRDPQAPARPRIVRRDDGSWLVDGALPIADFLEHLGLRELPGEETDFTTVGGLILAHLHRIPAAGDHLQIDNWRFEVVDMDRNRIDKVLVSGSGSPRPN